MSQSRPLTSFAFPADEAWRRRNMSRLLDSAAWLFDTRILGIVNRSGFPEIRMAHLHLPRNLDLKGSRLTELAHRAEMSKQAVARVEAEMRRELGARRVATLLAALTRYCEGSTGRPAD
jgi:hypothetical protein